MSGSWTTDEEDRQSFFYKELVIAPAYYFGEDEWKLRDIDSATSVGFEYFRIFSGDKGDWLTTDIQIRFPMGHKKRLRRNAYANFNLNFDFDEDKFKSIMSTEWRPMYEIHNLYANLKLNAGRSNIKIGHFDVPFGLEPLIDTHPTLLQTQASKNIGFKRDWGLSVNGALPSFDYEASATLGCGGVKKIWRKDGSYLFAGRIGTPTSNDLQYGFSLLYGRVLPALYDEYLFEKALSRKRIGVDGQYYYRAYLFKGELAYGKDEDHDILSGLLEVDYTVPRYQNLQLEAQLKTFFNDLDKGGSDDTIMTLGASYKLTNEITLRANYIHDFNLSLGEEEDIIGFQFYYYGQ